MSDRSYVTIKVGPLTADQAKVWNTARGSASRYDWRNPPEPRTLAEAFHDLYQRADEDPMEAVEGTVLEIIDNECASGLCNDELVAATVTLEKEGVAFEIADEGGPPGTWGPSVVWWRPGMAQPLQYLRHTDDPVVLFHTAAFVLARQHPEAWALLVEAAQWDPAWPIPTRSGVPADVIATAASR